MVDALSNSMTDILQVATPAISALLVAFLVRVRNQIEGSVEDAGHSVESAIENGIQSRLDKIEVGVWQNTERLQELEKHVNGGSGQHFTPPRVSATPPSEARPEQ